MTHLFGSYQGCEWELPCECLLSSENEFRPLVHFATRELRLDFAAEPTLLLVTDEALQLSDQWGFFPLCQSL